MKLSCRLIHWVLNYHIWELQPSSECLDCGYPRDELFETGNEKLERMAKDLAYTKYI